MINTIILLHGHERLTAREAKSFEKGDTIFGENSTPEELKRWPIDQKEQAVAELAKYSCSYKEDGQLTNITEYALEYCECDQDGEFVSGSNYDLAEEDPEGLRRQFLDELRKQHLEGLHKMYLEEVEEIAEQCRAEGYPDHGSNFELRVEALRRMYPELWE